jgi:hypothetical protein
MLNSLKQIKPSTNNLKKIAYPIFTLPYLPKTSFLQTLDFENFDLLADFKIVLRKTKPEIFTSSLRFTFSSSVFKSYFLFTSLEKKRIKKKNFFISQILFLHQLFRKEIMYPSFCIKRMKGNLMTTSLGFMTFLPKSCAILNKNPNKSQYLLSFRLLQRRKKKSLKKRFKFNFVSSCKRQTIK